jgi:hypothetical protein
MGPTDCPEISARDYHYTLRNSLEERSSQTTLQLTQCLVYPNLDSDLCQTTLIAARPALPNNLDITTDCKKRWIRLLVGSTVRDKPFCRCSHVQEDSTKRRNVGSKAYIFLRLNFKTV